MIIPKTNNTISPISPFKFNHPGTYMSPGMTKSLREKQSQRPDQEALTKLIKDTPLTYSPQALEVVDIDWGGKGKGHNECTKDGEVAVAAALIYWAGTPNQNPKRYAELALRILNAWSKKNKVWKGNNALLEASWSICSMARAAELLKYAPDKGIADAWKAQEKDFMTWLDTVIMPVLRSNHIWGWKPIGNWHFSQICCRMQIAILREDKKDFDWCIAKYREALDKALPCSKCNGESSETCRDVTHAQFLLGGLIQGPEMAFHQGVDIFDRRLVDAFELQARIMMKEIPEGLQAIDIKTPYGYYYEPVWHIAVAHFNGRKGIPMPHTIKYLSTIGPQRDRVCFHWGPNYLTHATS